MNLAHNVSVSRAMDSQAAGTSTPLNGATIDMQGWDGILFVAIFGAIVAGALTAFKVQQGQASNMSDAADLLGSGITIADDQDNKVAVSDIYRPQERYVRAVVTRSTQNATVDAVIAIRYRGRKAPSALDATVIAAEYHQSPIEGTA